MTDRKFFLGAAIVSFLLAAICAAGVVCVLTGCGGTPDLPPCGPGTYEFRRICLPTKTEPPCGPGTHEVSGTCVADPGLAHHATKTLVCGKGTHEENGVCVADQTTKPAACPEPTVTLSNDNPGPKVVQLGTQYVLVMAATFKGPSDPQCAVSIKSLQFVAKGSASSDGLYWEQDEGGGSNASDGHVANGIINAGPGQLKWLGNGTMEMYLQIYPDPKGLTGTTFGFDLVSVKYNTLNDPTIREMNVGLPLMGAWFTYAPPTSFITVSATTDNPPSQTVTMGTKDLELQRFQLAFNTQEDVFIDSIAIVDDGDSKAYASMYNFRLKDSAITMTSFKALLLQNSVVTGTFANLGGWPKGNYPLILSIVADVTSWIDGGTPSSHRFRVSQVMTHTASGAPVKITIKTGADEPASNWIMTTK